MQQIHKTSSLWPAAQGNPPSLPTAVRPTALLARPRYAHGGQTRRLLEPDLASTAWRQEVTGLASAVA